MLSAIVPLNRNGSCSTIAICARRLARVTCAHVVAVDAHRAGGHVVEARDQVGDRRLAGAGLADERDRLARLDRRSSRRASTGAALGS